jgi:hypothetical protein
VPVDKSIRNGDSFAIVARGEALETNEMSVAPDDVGPVLCIAQLSATKAN